MVHFLFISFQIICFIFIKATKYAQIFTQKATLGKNQWQISIFVFDKQIVPFPRKANLIKPLLQKVQNNNNLHYTPLMLLTDQNTFAIAAEKRYTLSLLPSRSSKFPKRKWTTHTKPCVCMCAGMCVYVTNLQRCIPSASGPNKWRKRRSEKTENTTAPLAQTNHRRVTTVADIGIKHLKLSRDAVSVRCVPLRWGWWTDELSFIFIRHGTQVRASRPLHCYVVLEMEC